MTLTLHSAIAAYGRAAKAKLANVAAAGEPEEQLRTPLETLLLASKAASYVTGQVLTVDGGMTG